MLHAFRSVHCSLSSTEIFFVLTGDRTLDSAFWATGHLLNFSPRSLSGMELNNPKTYIGRVLLHNEKCFGRVVPSSGSCFCLHKTMEHKRSVYEVLVNVSRWETDSIGTHRLKWAIPGLFQTNINTILQQINVKKFPSSIWHWDSNPRPSECESPPITRARPGTSVVVWFGLQELLLRSYTNQGYRRIS